jgi:hypothetical protein
VCAERIYCECKSDGTNGDNFIVKNKTPHKASLLLFNPEVIAACSQIHTTHLNTKCGKYVDLRMLKLWYIL